MKSKHLRYRFIWLLLLIAIAGIYILLHQPTRRSVVDNQPTVSAAVAPKPAKDVCSTSELGQELLVSIGARHLWACDGKKQVYSSAVITGMENFAADLTPVGTYHIYSKQTNRYLDGSDSTGSWHDYVYYWMPWLSNRYGTYGFHDATWRSPGDFGHISPDSNNASHGCVELPLAAAKWVYNWAPIGTTVKIVS